LQLALSRYIFFFTGPATQDWPAYAEDHMATGPELRVGDADREATAAALREHFAQGRLTLEELNARLDATFAATTQRELSGATRDLPHAAAPSAPLPVTTSWEKRERERREHRSGYRTRARLGFIPALIALIGAWFVAFDLLMPHLRVFSFLPGRLAIFVAIFAGFRWLLRRVFGLGRGRGLGGGCGRR
jgi:cation transport ATPase